MNIIVCVKQVPSSAGARIDPKTNTILRDGKASVINPFDSHALEAALLLKDTCGGKVSALSMGIPAICPGCVIGSGAHTREEYVEIDSLLPGLKMALQLILHHF